MTALLLLACTAPVADSGHDDHDDHDDPPGTYVPAVPEAEDLDPADGAVRFALTADETEAGYAYDGQVPGPTLRARVGDTVTVDFVNALDADTTIHWHGMRVPNAMDGVAWMSDPVAPGEAFTYTFTADRAGTFWYHPHVDVDHQMELGLYGAIVIEDPADPPVEELLLVFDLEGETSEEGSTHGDSGAASPPPPSGSDTGHGGDGHGHGTTDTSTLPWTLNGAATPAKVRVRGGTVVRVRMVNAAIEGYLDLSWPGLRRIGGDQGLYGAAVDGERIVLAPSDRAELEWRVGEEGFTVTRAPYAVQGASVGEAETLFEVVVDDPAPAPESPAWPFSGAGPTEDPAYTDLVYVFSGGDHDGDWMINGEAWPNVTATVVPRDAPLIVEARNLSQTEHPFHLHGHAFEVLGVDGAPPATRTDEDSVNVGIRGTVRMRLVPDNPGDWMLHCHIARHEEGGMMTVFRVE